MTSPDFMYPQPTDDELAAQQPYTAALGSHVHGVGHSSAVGRSTGTEHMRSSGHSPAAPGTDPDHDGASPAGANRPRLGKVALVVAIVAAGLSLIASFVLGVTIVPMEVEYGYYFTDTPSWYRNLAIALFGLQTLCAALGVTGLIMGIVSAVTGRGRTQGIVAIAMTILAPFVSFALFMVLSFAFA